MKKLLITGSYPPDVCGVGDYTHCFMNETNNDWELYYNSNWNISSYIKKIKDINSFNCEALVLQYPTQGYGWSILPQLILLYYSIFTNKKCYVVLHELSQRTFKARLATSLFFLSSKIIFTSEFERNFAINKYRLNKDRTTVINIISNIPAGQQLKKWDERKIDLIYFGHLRPKKGLEDFLFVANQITDTNQSIKICIIGQKLPEYEEYTKNLFEAYKHLNITFLFNADIEQVMKILNEAKITFLPFPDGISERRGSFLAAISNGSLVVSYKGQYTTELLMNIFFETDKYNAKFNINELLNLYNNNHLEKYHMLCRNYLENNLPKSWNEVVLLYNNFIERN